MTITLTAAEKAALTGGVDMWHTAGVERLGLPGLRLTDGPNGARGVRLSSDVSACLPCASALAATWDRDLVRRVGHALASEARAKGAQALLAPTVNMHRHPLTGRHFECYSEDPYLTSELAVAYITGVQEYGVAAVVKHFVCNDQEYQRHSISVEVDERTLREIYLPPFEAAVARAGVWGVMAAYNRLHGEYCSESRALLTHLLTDEWGFDGLVISDWRGTHSAQAVDAGLDLEMPGPAQFLGEHLLHDEAGSAAHAAGIDRAADRMLRLMERALRSEPSPSEEKVEAVAREAAAEAIVLLRNDGLLPLDAAALRSIAVIGPLANRLAAQGGGSAEVTPGYVVSLLDALHGDAALGLDIRHEPGCALPGLLPVLDRLDVHVEYFANPDFNGEPVGTETLSRIWLRWMGQPAPGAAVGNFSARFSATFVPDQSGSWQFGLVSAGQSRLRLDEQLLLDNFAPVAGDTFYGRGSQEVTAAVELQAGTAYQLTAEFRIDTGAAFAAIRIGAELRLPADALERAVEAAARAEVAIVVVGYDGRWESEGFDRPHLALPGEQAALIRAVVAANTRTVVVLNTGSPVVMDWAEVVPALVQLWFPGQEGGAALAHVLFGQVNPSGRLPTTFPRSIEDTPAHANYPGSDGVVRYAEGLMVGYRHYDARAVAPLFCFGHGLSYTTFEYANLIARSTADSVYLTLDVTNTGKYAGAEVVQVYVRAIDSGVERPDKELKDFAKLVLEPGETGELSFTLSDRAFAFWDVDLPGWRVTPGEWEILVGASSRDIRLTQRVSVNT